MKRFSKRILVLTLMALLQGPVMAEKTYAGASAQLDKRLAEISAGVEVPLLRAYLNGLREQLNAAPEGDDARRGVAGAKADLALRVARSIAEIGEGYPLAAASLTYYAVPAVSPVKRLPGTFPDDGVLCGALRVVAAKGEFEPASFVVFPFENAARASLTVSDLVGRGGTIPSANVDVAIVKCWYQAGTAWYSYFADYTGRELVPELLLHDENLIRVDHQTRDNYLRVDYPTGPEYVWISNPLCVNVPFNAEKEPVADAETIQPFALKAGEFKQFWVTVGVPYDASAGVYDGTIELRCEGAEAVSIPISVRVLPFELPAPKTYYDTSREFYTMLYNGPNYIDILKRNGGDWAHADRKMLALYRNMKRHNILHPRFPDFAAPSRDAFVRANSRQAFIRQLEIMRLAGVSTNPIFGGIPAIPPYRWMTSVEDVPLARQSPPGALVSRIDESFDIVKKVLGHTNVYCFGWDEPAIRLLVAERKPWRYIHDKGLKVFSTGTDKHLDYAGYNEDCVNCPGGVSRERAAAWHAMGCLILNYAGPHTGPENPDFMRRVHGLQLYKANYDGIGNYKLSCTEWNDFLGEVYNFRRFNMTYPTREGVIDTIEWEGVREAVDDVRYATLLKLLARAAADSDNVDAVYLGRQALLWLERVDESSADLNSIRLEMVNRILDLARFVRLPEVVERREPVETAAISPSPARASIPPAPEENVEHWKEVMQGERVADELYRKAAFKVIELLATRGDVDEARAAAERAASDKRLAVPDRFLGRLLVLGMESIRAHTDLKTGVEKAAAAFPAADLAPEAKVKAFAEAGKFFMQLRRYAIVRDFLALRESMLRQPPRKLYQCRYVRGAPTSVEGWLHSPLYRDPEAREARFMDYNRQGRELLVYDVRTERPQGAEGAGDKETAFIMAYDEEGWHIFVECTDSEAEKAACGLLTAGKLEMFFSPGLGECYYQWMLDLASGTLREYLWNSPNPRFRPMSGYCRSDAGLSDRGFGAALFIPWVMLYDRLPREGDTWPFNIIRWGRAGGVTWSGKVHEIHRFGKVRWAGLGPERLLAIKRRIVLKALARYRKARDEAVAHWKDEVLGDPGFFEKCLLPVVERLDRFASAAGDDMSDAEVETLFIEAVPDWMEFDYKVAESRRLYLNRKFFGVLEQ